MEKFEKCICMNIQRVENSLKIQEKKSSFQPEEDIEMTCVYYYTKEDHATIIGEQDTIWTCHLEERHPSKNGVWASTSKLSQSSCPTFMHLPPSSPNVDPSLPFSGGPKYVSTNSANVLSLLISPSSSSDDEVSMLEDDLSELCPLGGLQCP